MLWPWVLCRDLCSNRMAAQPAQLWLWSQLCRACSFTDHSSNCFPAFSCCCWVFVYLFAFFFFLLHLCSWCPSGIMSFQKKKKKKRKHFPCFLGLCDFKCIFLLLVFFFFFSFFFLFAFLLFWLPCRIFFFQKKKKKKKKNPFPLFSWALAC